jgi:hypothetical protein
MGNFGFLEFASPQVSCPKDFYCSAPLIFQEAEDALRDLGGRDFMGERSAARNFHIQENRLTIQHHSGAPKRNSPKGCLRGVSLLFPEFTSLADKLVTVDLAETIEVETEPMFLEMVWEVVEKVFE